MPFARTIQSIEFSPLNIELSEPFGIASGEQVRAQNVLVRLRLSDGSEGLGEAAPFAAVNQETQSAALAALAEARPALQGMEGSRWRLVAATARRLCGAAPSALCALESALLDALCRSANLSLFEFFGGSNPHLISDITIPTGSVERAEDSARRAAARGFQTLKIKVGGAALDEDLERLRAILAAAPASQLILDANASLSANEAIRLIQGLGQDTPRVSLFEQPTARGDFDAMRKVQSEIAAPVAADESARSASDIAELARYGCCRVINFKISKSGIAQTLDMIAAAKAHGLGLMIGGMVESQLAMSVSACLAAGLGGFEFVDLDTPLFMKNAPFIGGMTRRGPNAQAHISVSSIRSGHGVSSKL